MKDIKGFEGLYAITRDGRVWSYGSRKWLKFRGSGKSGKILTHKRDYKTICLYKKRKPHYFYIHRLVAQSFIGNPMNKKQVNHINGIKSDNNVNNLEWCSGEENIVHAFKNGLTTRGDKNTHTKLNETQVRNIRKEYLSGKISQGEIAKKYNVSQSNIYLILKKVNWSYVD